MGSQPIPEVISCSLVVKSMKMCVLGPFRIWWKSWKHASFGRFSLFWAVFGHMLPGIYMYDMLSYGFPTYPRGHTLLHCCKIDENVCFRSISELVKSWKITGFRCFSLFWAVLGHMLPGTYMYDMLSYGFPTYPRGHTLLHCCKIDENVCFRSISDLVKIMKTHWFFDVFRCFEWFWGICYQGYICMICCPMGSQPIPEVISCFIVVKSMKMCVLGPFRSWWKS